MIKGTNNNIEVQLIIKQFDNLQEYMEAYFDLNYTKKNIIVYAGKYNLDFNSYHANYLQIAFKTYFSELKESVGYKSTLITLVREWLKNNLKTDLYNILYVERL